MSALSDLKDAIVGGLRADPTIAGIVGQKVYDEVPRDQRGEPSDAEAPFIYIGPIGRRRLEYGDRPAWTVSARLYCVSSAVGRADCWDMADAVHAALDLQNFEMPNGNSHDRLKVIGDGDVIAPGAPKQVFLDLTTNLFSADLYDGAGPIGA